MLQKRGTLLFLALLLVLLSACGNIGAAQTEAVTGPPNALMMDSYKSLAELEQALRDAKTQKTENSYFPDYYIQPQAPINPEVAAVDVREGYYVAIRYASDENGYESVYAWFRDSLIEAKLESLVSNDIPYDELRDGEQIYYIATAPDEDGNPHDYLFYFDWNGHIIQANLPAALGAYENALPYLQMEKIIP